MAFDTLDGADLTFPFIRSYVLTGSGDVDTDLKEEIGWYPRAVIAGAAGDLVYRLANDDADRTLPVVQGQMVVGMFKQIGTATDCSPHLFT